MARKLRFKPEITRIKLNPEQAVLTCTCHDGTRHWVYGSTHRPDATPTTLTLCENIVYRPIKNSRKVCMTPTGADGTGRPYTSGIGSS